MNTTCKRALKVSAPSAAAAMLLCAACGSQPSTSGGGNVGGQPNGVPVITHVHLNGLGQPPTVTETLLEPRQPGTIQTEATGNTTCTGATLELYAASGCGSGPAICFTTSGSEGWFDYGTFCASREAFSPFNCLVYWDAYEYVDWSWDSFNSFNIGPTDVTYSTFAGQGTTACQGAITSQTYSSYVEIY